MADLPNPRRGACLLALLLTFCGCRAPSPSAAGAANLPSLARATSGLRAIDGFLPMWWDEPGQRLLLELPPEGEPFLYWVSLLSGLGSNDVGLDRGQLGPQRVVSSRVIGRRALLIEENTTWRTSSPSPAERRAAEESFAASAVYGFDVVARSESRVLVAAGDFFVRDAHGISRRLKGAGQGSYTLDAGRSVVLEGEARGFPDNSQVDALLTFAGEVAGPEVAATAADGHALTLRVRHGFARLPSGGFEPRRFHPSSGYWPVTWNDLGAALDEPLARSFVPRHRLEKRYRERAASEPLEPIVYYIDSGAPEPVRSALLEGARYWAPVFEAAGFLGGFRAELLPEGVDPHDMRFNVLQWVDRSTRGWSYGETITDPRTGEILKGHVTLGALRVRQDLLLAEGLLSPYEADDADPRALEMALARIRQLAAHEIGHTLGLAHNFAASVDGRASVMDYPAPLVNIDASGALDLSDAYRDGCGEWDQWVIRYGYADFSYLQGGRTLAEREEIGLAQVLDQGRELGLHYLTDQDARGNDRAHPLANLWDNGADPVEYLAHELAVRSTALANFSPAALKRGRPLAELEELLVPLYLHHRYQLEAAVRSLGGADYTYELRGDAPVGVTPVPANRQERALELTLSTLTPGFLALPARLQGLIPPRPPGSAGHRELNRPGALLFDPHELAATSIELTLELLLDPGRCARLVDQSQDGRGLPGLQRVLDELFELGWAVPAAQSPSSADLLRAELRIGVARHLMRLAADEAVAWRVREPAQRALARIAEHDSSGPLLRDILRRHAEDPTRALEALEPPRIPPGSPIGCAGGPGEAEPWPR